MTLGKQAERLAGASRVSVRALLATGLLWLLAAVLAAVL